ncbi:MAG: toll/interleukin-1 receptor domain-containing protein [Desulfobacterales bacterium]
MAQSPGYEHDIFISYAHNDNYGIADRPGWVDVFEEALDNWLRKRRGMGNLRIWRDKQRMHGSTLFDDAIQNAIDTSAIFLALTSRNYLQSDYCRKELRRFYQHHGLHSDGLRIGDSSRIFNILLNNIPHPNWPTEFQGTSGFPMHDARSDDELGDFTSPRDDRYEKRMRPIIDALEKIFEKLSPTPAADSTSRDNRVAIFMADVPEALQDFKDRVIAEVEYHDAGIQSDIPPPMVSAEHEEAVTLALARSRFAVHLLNQWPGRKLQDRKDLTFPREQHEIAFKQSIPQLVWVPSDLDIATIENDAQRRFLESCETRPRAMGQYEFVRCLQSEFVNLVGERIAGLREEVKDETRRLSFLIDTHQKDQRYAFRLADFLLDKGVDVDFNHESSDPVVSLIKFEQSVKKVKNLVLVCGQVGPAWLVGRIKKAFKTISEQFETEEKLRLEHIWLFLAPNSSGKPDLPAFPPLIKINVLDNSRSEHIDPQLTSQLLFVGATP